MVEKFGDLQFDPRNSSGNKKNQSKFAMTVKNQRQKDPGTPVKRRIIKAPTTPDLAIETPYTPEEPSFEKERITAKNFSQMCGVVLRESEIEGANQNPHQMFENYPEFSPLPNGHACHRKSLDATPESESMFSKVQTKTKDKQGTPFSMFGNSSPGKTGGILTPKEFVSTASPFRKLTEKSKPGHDEYQLMSPRVLSLKRSAEQSPNFRNTKSDREIRPPK